MKIPCIFIVDDNYAILESYKIILEHEGYRIFTATNGFELRVLMSKQLPDLILMDYNLDEENGGILTQDIKGNSQTSSIPIIMISADFKYRTIAMLMGADDFLEKPIEIPLLISKIEEYLIREWYIQTLEQI